jgi:catechol 2,3-dioxygenase-like lactoylglutathione lyase family enzyme
MNQPDPLRPSFRGGPNIAMKIPPSEYEATVSFYRDVIGLPLLDSYRPDNVFRYGSSLLWLDCVPELERTEVWLELLTPDTAITAEQLSRSGVERSDSVEVLPDGFDGFWIRSPASVVHLVTVRQTPE